jgi:hypothetical protein
MFAVLCRYLLSAHASHGIATGISLHLDRCVWTEWICASRWPQPTDARPRKRSASAVIAYRILRPALLGEYAQLQKAERSLLMSNTSKSNACGSTYRMLCKRCTPMVAFTFLPSFGVHQWTSYRFRAHGTTIRISPTSSPLSFRMLREHPSR